MFSKGVHKLLQDCKKYFMDSINKSYDPLDIMTTNLEYMRNFIENVDYLE